MCDSGSWRLEKQRGSDFSVGETLGWTIAVGRAGCHHKEAAGGQGASRLSPCQVQALSGASLVQGGGGQADTIP